MHLFQRTRWHEAAYDDRWHLAPLQRTERVVVQFEQLCGRARFDRCPRRLWGPSWSRPWSRSAVVGGSVCQRRAQPVDVRAGAWSYTLHDVLRSTAVGSTAAVDSLCWRAAPRRRTCVEGMAERAHLWRAARMCVRGQATLRAACTRLAAQHRLRIRCTLPSSARRSRANRRTAAAAVGADVLWSGARTAQQCA